MKAEYRLVKLKTETVQALTRLKDETCQPSLNDLVAEMIRLTDRYRAGLKETGWKSFLGGE